MQNMPSVMTHDFSRVPRAEIPRSQFDRSHGYKTTFDAGYLIPVFIDEALPGDTFNLQMTAFARLATPLKPIMDNMKLDSFFFAIPYRLVWDNFQKFMGEQLNPGDSTDFVIPQMVSPVGGYLANSVHDYFGLPVGVAGITHSSLWHRALNLTWNEWFRDQNLQDSLVVDRDDGPDDPADYVLQRRGKRHDYITSCLPWPQKGAAVTVPLGSTAPVEATGVLRLAENLAGTTNPGNVFRSSATNPSELDISVAGTINAPLYYSSGLQVDLNAATAATINVLRQAFQIQRLYERDARGGTRYTELLRAHFGVVSPDARLQRPEYLGGGSSDVIVHPIAQMSSTDATTPQGNLAAMGTVSVRGHGFTKSFTEHTLLIGLVSVRADLTYQQGLNRMWSRSTRFDHYWPALAHIGEQAVLSKEVFCDGTAGDEDVFGYQARWDEMRYKQSLVTGEFRSSFAQSLDLWHLSQDFATRPLLNDEFIVENPPIDRIIAVPDEPHFLFDAFFHLKCARPMPVYGVPGMIDHF